MAIKKCRECKKKVSSEAATCPHCGVAEPYRPPAPPPPPPPPKPKTKAHKWLIGICWGSMFLIIGICVYNTEPPPPKTAKEIAAEKKAEKKRLQAQKRKAKEDARQKKEEAQQRKWAQERHVDCASWIRRKFSHTGLAIETPYTRRSSIHFPKSSLFYQKFIVTNAFGAKIKYQGTCVYNVKKNTVDVQVVKRSW